MLVLLPDEIEALTARQTRPAQVRMLRHMCIEHRIRADGSIAVLRSHVDAVLGGKAEQRKERTMEPDWS